MNVDDYLEVDVVEINDMNPPTIPSQDGATSQSPPDSAVNWDDRLELWEGGGGVDLPPQHQHHHQQNVVGGDLQPAVAGRIPFTNNNHPHLFGGEGPLQQIASWQRLEGFRERRKQVLIGLSIVVVSVVINSIVINMFSVALTAPQFKYYDSNGTRIHVYLWGEGTGSVYDELTPLPECMGTLYRSVLSDVITSNVLAVLALFFTAMSCSCATKPWRFTRPLLLLVSSILGGFAAYLVGWQYGMGCDGESRRYKADDGSLHILIGSILCLALSLSTFAQVSRYPLRELPSLDLLMGKYKDDDEEQQQDGDEGDQIMQERGEEEYDDRRVEDEEMQV